VISEIERSAPTVFDLVTPDDVQFAARFIKPTDPGLAPYVTHWWDCPRLVAR